jgi:hypothetical protein
MAMSSTYLTPTEITKRSLVILHQKLNFVGSINRQYDASFAKDGAKIGEQLKIRLPNKYTVRTGAVMAAQDVTEQSVTMAVSTMKGVDMVFANQDLTMTIDRFEERYIQPAMSVLAAAIEADALSMYKDVYQASGTVGSAVTTAGVLGVGKKLTDALAPGNSRELLVNTQAQIDVIEAMKTLFQPSSDLAEQMREGAMGRAQGFNYDATTHLNTHTPGSEVASAVAGSASTSTITINGANQTGAAVTVTNGSTKTLLKGDVIILPGVNRVHPETKADTGVAQQFVVTADVASNGTSIPISPSIVVTGALQNVTASPTDAAKIGKVGTASTAYGLSLGYQKDAFAIAFADLEMPDTGAFKARETMDGISMRILRGFDIKTNETLARIDVLYGFKTVRPELACRLHSN